MTLSPHLVVRAAMACALALGASAGAQADRSASVSVAEVPAANPARPTVTNPATLPPVGYLQFEQGYLGSLGSPGTDSQYGLNQATKLAVHPRLMLVVASQPFARSGVAGTVSHDAGAVTLGAQVVVFTPPVRPAAKPAEGAAAAPAKTAIPSIAITYAHTVFGGSTADTDLGSNTNAMGLLFSGDVGGFHYDTNLLLNEQDGDSSRPSAGAPGTIRRAQFAQTLSVNHQFLFKKMQLGQELYHFTQPLVMQTVSGAVVRRANAVDALTAISYTARNNLVFDAGFSRGLTSTSTRWQSFVGFTYLLPQRLWGGKC